jgi:hypothetical protein
MKPTDEIARSRPNGRRMPSGRSRYSQRHARKKCVVTMVRR